MNKQQKQSQLTAQVDQSAKKSPKIVESMKSNFSIATICSGSLSSRIPGYLQRKLGD